MPLKTEKEIVERIKQVREEDMFGFKIEVLADFLDSKTLLDLKILKEGLSEEELRKWDEEHSPLTEESVKKELTEYMEFAWGKAQDHRGLSAGRSVDKCSTYAWILGADDLITRIENEEIGYAQYGCPILAAICERFNLPIPQTQDIQNMIAGKPCEPDCNQGCGS